MFIYLYFNQKIEYTQNKKFIIIKSMTENTENKLSDTETKKEAVSKLIEQSSLTNDFYLMLVLSSIFVAMGLLLNNVVVVIGGMLVTPFLSPILRLSLAVVISDKDIIKMSIISILKASGVVLATSLVATFLVPKASVDWELIDRIFESANLFYVYIAIAAGVAAAYAWARPNLSNTLPGIAISVTLLPPIALIGIGFAFLNSSLVSAGARSFLINFLGLLLSTTFVFSILGFYRVRDHVKKEVKKEEENHIHQK